jgi:hypothetical protein
MDIFQDARAAGAKHMPPDDFDAFIADVPLLHDWDKGWSMGGFGPPMLKKLRSIVAPCFAAEAPIVAETGAGNTTILFLLLRPKRVYSIAPDLALRDRILAYCAKNRIDTGALHFIANRSEPALPELAAGLHAENLQLDLALMDGGHGWPTVFVDFCYFNAMLRKGGLLLVDDLQIYSVNEFARWLSMQKEYSLVADLKKTLVWRKETADAFLGDFRSQPYVDRRSKERAAMPDPFGID